MHLICTLCPSAQSANVPVAIFSLGEERKLLFVPESYQETLRLVAENFDLEEDVVLSLRTSTINVFRGKEVEITQSAFTYVRPCLGEVKVTIVERSQSRRHQKRAQEKGRAITPVPPEYPSSSVKDGDDFEPQDLPMASSTVIHPEAVFDEQPLGSPKPDGVGKAIGGPCKAAHTTEGKADHSQEHADGERIIDQLEIPQKTVVVPPKAANLQPIAELQDKGEGGSNSLKKFKPAGVLLSKSNREIGSPVRVKKELIAGPANEEPVKPIASAPPSQPEEDPRFEISIVGPQNEIAQFKTRGKHPVRKVLAAACKTFDVKYERARLILCVSIEEGGEIQTDEFDCPADETMSQCGVDANAKLFVRVEPDDDEEYEEDY